MSADTVHQSRPERGVVVLTLDRPASANALNPTLVDDLLTVIHELEDDDELTTLVVTGAGRHFCAGADLRDRDHSPAWFRAVRDAFDRLEGLPLATIAAINGAALGGGCELALACDLRVIDASAQIGLPEIRIGALAVAGGTQRLPRAVGLAKARELLYLGHPVDAEEARRIGLVNRVAAEGTALEVALELAATIAGRSRDAVLLAKQLTRVADGTALAEGLRIEAAASASLLADLSPSFDEAARTEDVYGRILGPTGASDPTDG